MIKKVTKDWQPTLRSMNVGDVFEFPVKAGSVVSSSISRLRFEMCVEGADWKREGEPDREKGTFRVKRIS